MIRPFPKALGFLLVALALCASCSPLPSATFPLTTEQGVELPLYPESRSAQIAAGAITGSGKDSALYSLKDPVTLRGVHPALELRYSLDGAARVDLYAGKGRGRPFLSLDLARGPGEIRWLIPLETGSTLATFRFTPLARGAAPNKEEPSQLSILGLSIREAEYGIGIDPHGASLSRGSALVRDPESARETLSVEHPYMAEDKPVAILDAGKGRVRLRAVEGRTAIIDFFHSDTVVLPLSALGGQGTVRADADSPGALRRLFVRPLSALEELLALDLGVILALPPPGDSQSPYSLYRWSALPETLVFDFRDYDIQDAYLKRLAFFVEKEGFRGRLASNAELSGLHGWNAHDYRAQDLAHFFDSAARASFPLTVEEKELEGILERQGILVRQGSKLLPGKGALISISRESSGYFRRLFLGHEASHALMFLDEDYRKLAQSLWKAQGVEERRFWNVFLSNRDYDPGADYLSYNELQAYMVQQPLSRLEAWLRDVAYARLAKSYPERAAAMLADLEAALPGFQSRAAALDSYLRKTYGLGAGYFERIRFE